MGVSAQQHRVCVGLFNCIVCNVSVRQNNNFLNFVMSQLCTPNGLFLCLLIVYFYVITYIIFMNLACVISPINPSIKYTPSIKPLPTLLTNINLWFLLITFTVINNSLKRIIETVDDTSIFSICKHLFRNLFSRPLHGVNTAKKYLSLATNGITLFLFSLNIILIIICNPSMLNPGPDSLSVFYNNVQGFINTRDLASESPPLNMTKVHEIQGFIFKNKPDVLIFNETWLKNLS